MSSSVIVCQLSLLGLGDFFLNRSMQPASYLPGSQTFCIYRPWILLQAGLVALCTPEDLRSGTAKPGILLLGGLPFDAGGGCPYYV